MFEEEKEKEFVDGVEVQKLPTIGEAYSMKTAKQGRVGTVKQNSGYDATDIARTIVSNKTKYKARSFRKNTLVEVKFNCKRIINYKLATTAMKKAATDCLHNIETAERVNNYLITTVNGITRTLSKKYKDF